MKDEVLIVESGLTDKLGSSVNRLTQVDPADLARVPEVGELLHRLELGAFEPDDLVSYLGRNDNWAGTTTSGHKVFVKRLGGGQDEALMPVRRVSAFEELIPDAPRNGVRRPRCLGWDESAKLLVFEWLDTARNGLELAHADAFDEILAEQAGRVVGELHALDIGPDERLDATAPPLPPHDRLRALPLQAFSRASAAELEAWKLLQQDDDLIRALQRMRLQEQQVVPTPVHGDLRLDQFLLDGETLHLTDWEEFRRADPARDVGAFAGEWLHRAIIGLTATSEWNERAAFARSEPSHLEIVRNGALELDRLRPRIAAFWKGYRHVRDVEEGLATRATEFAGWHMIDRLLAHASERPRLTGIARAAAGIGRTALLSPEDFTATLGLGEQQSEDGDDAG